MKRTKVKIKRIPPFGTKGYEARDQAAVKFITAIKAKQAVKSAIRVPEPVLRRQQSPKIVERV